MLMISVRNYCNSWWEVCSVLLSWSKILGGPPPPKKIRDQKHAKYGTISDDFKIQWQIFPERRYSKSDKYVIYRDSSRVRWKKSGEHLSSNQGDLKVKLYPPKAPFSEDHISALRGAVPPNFDAHLRRPGLAGAPPNGDWGLPSNFFKGGGIKKWLKI